MAWLVSPTEPAALKALGIVCPTPEDYGADYLTSAPDGLVAVQRKDFNDLLNSLYDGRLQKELFQLQHPEVAHPFLLVEGRPLFTDDGMLLNDRRKFSKAQWMGLVLSSIVESNVPVVLTDDLRDTVDWLDRCEKWFDKAGHGSIRNRPKRTDDWGEYSHKEFCIQLLQSFPGIGVKTAESFYEHFEGELPLKWLISEKELMKVPGIGKVTARNLIEYLGGGNSGR